MNRSTPFPLSPSPESPEVSGRPFLSTGWAIGWRVAVYFSVWGVLMAPLFVLAAEPLKTWAEEKSLLAHLYPDAAGLIATLAALALCTWYLERRSLRTLGLGGGWRAVGDFVRGLGLGVVWLGISLGAAWLAGWVSPRAIETVSWPRFAGLSSSLLLNVITQQLLLCGFVWQTIQARAGFRAAFVTSVILFSTYHVGAFHGALLPALNVMGAAAVFGLCYRLAGNLWLPIGCHFAWNALLGQVLGLTVSGSQALNGGWLAFELESNRFTGGAFGFEGGLLVTLTTAVMAAGLAWAVFRKRPGCGYAANEPTH